MTRLRLKLRSGEVYSYSQDKELKFYKINDQIKVIIAVY